MRASGIRDAEGPVEELELTDPRSPREGEVLVEVRAAGIGNWDELVRTGEWDVGIRPPMALGVEAAGLVRSIGPGVTRLARGDAILVHSAPLRYQGAWAELFLAKADDVAAKPAGLEWSVAGALPVPLLTAVQVCAGLRRGSDESVLVHGAGGITGGLIVAVASASGARVFATCSPGAAQRVIGYGATETFDYRDPDWRGDARRRAPGGFSTVVNVARGEAAALLALVADGGRLATITGDPPPSERAISVSDVYVVPDGTALESAAADLVSRGLSVRLAGTCGLDEVAGTLGRVVGGGGDGAYVVMPTG